MRDASKPRDMIESSIMFESDFWPFRSNATSFSLARSPAERVYLRRSRLWRMLTACWSRGSSSLTGYRMSRCHRPLLIRRFNSTRWRGRSSSASPRMAMNSSAGTSRLRAGWVNWTRGTWSGLTAISYFGLYLLSKPVSFEIKCTRYVPGAISVKSFFAIDKTLGSLSSTCSGIERFGGFVARSRRSSPALVG